MRQLAQQAAWGDAFGSLADGTGTGTRGHPESMGKCHSSRHGEYIEVMSNQGGRQYDDMLGCSKHNHHAGVHSI